MPNLSDDRPQSAPTFEVSTSILSEAYLEVEALGERIFSAKPTQQRTSFKLSRLKSVIFRFVESILVMCYYSLRSEGLSHQETSQITEIQANTLKLYHRLAKSMDSMTLVKEIAELSRLTKPYTTTNKDAAQAWEAEHFAEINTTYLDPSAKPNIPSLEIEAQKHGVNTTDPDMLSEEVAQLSKLTQGEYFTQEELEEIFSDPERTKRAKKLGLLPHSAV